MNIEIAPAEYEIKANWNDARLYCFSLNIDGNIGWRLPKLSELYDIFWSFNDFKKSCYYWSAEDLNDYFAWFRLTNGNQFYGRKHEVYYVRPVRDR